ncbi:hypothetical protein [Reyranella sp.]|uniref:hypothetical protein n=1 Tax=Reyranella sp. TaxID=1929291 RepID=UPI003D0BB023
MSKKPRFSVTRLFKRGSATSPEKVAVKTSEEATVELNEETEVEMVMAKEPKNSEDVVVALRAEVELLELRVRKAQAREWLRKHKAAMAEGASK